MRRVMVTLAFFICFFTSFAQKTTYKDLLQGSWYSDNYGRDSTAFSLIDSTQLVFFSLHQSPLRCNYKITWQADTSIMLLSFDKGFYWLIKLVDNNTLKLQQTFDKTLLWWDSKGITTPTGTIVRGKRINM
jgi:hypothetical protein